MKKNILILLSLFLLFQLVPGIVLAKEPIKIIFNGQEVVSDAPPKLMNNRVLVPVRVVSETLGYKVLWDGELKKVTILNDTLHVNFVLNESFIWKNGEKITLDVAPFAETGRSYLPIRAVAENLGASIDWNGSTQSVIINQKKSPVNVSSQESGTKTDTPVQEEPTTNEESKTDSDTSENTTQTPNDLEENQQDSQTTNETDKDQQSTESSTEQVDPIQNELISIIQDGTSLYFETKDTNLLPTVFQLSDPYRLVVDFNSMQLRPEVVIQKLKENDLIQGIRYSQYMVNPNQVRIVIDLKQKADFTIQKDNQFYLLKIQPHIYKVVIDAGHGGKDPGAISVFGRMEKDFNLAVVLRVKELLKNEPLVQAIYTRADDTYPTLDERVDLANNLGADIFMSIHANLLPGRPDVSGSETYYTREDSLLYAQIMHKYLLQATGYINRGIRTADYRVTKYTTMPAVLLEVGYLSNQDEEYNLYQPETQQRVAEGIVKGIKEYLQLNK